MLRTLNRLLRRSADGEQYTFEFAPPPATADELLLRLRMLGMYRIDRCRLTRNRSVMVSFGGGELRIHEGYLRAPEPVLRAVVRLVQCRTRAERREAQRVIVGFPVVNSSVPNAVRRERTRAEDQPMCDELARRHAELNALHFNGALAAVNIRVSRRMKSRLGHYTSAGRGYPAEIALSRRHVRRHGWTEATHTLLHEMVHQWQDETGLPLDHGPTFRAKAREVGITARALRALQAPAADGRRPTADGAPSAIDTPPISFPDAEQATHHAVTVS